MSRTAVSLLTIALAGLAGCEAKAPTDVQLGQALSAIQGGEVDEGLTNVVGIEIRMGFGMGLCSGSLIAPNLVLTAHHCVAETPSESVTCGRARFGEPYATSAFQVTTGTEVFSNRSTFYRVREVNVPDVASDLCGMDLAVLLLDGKVPEGVALPLKPRIDRPVTAGERFMAAGFGEIGNGNGSGTRRSVGGKRVLCGEGQCRAGGQVTNSEWVGSDGACQGDSGGPALDGAGLIIGVLSRGGPGCQQPVYSSANAWGDWLREMARHAAEVGGYEADAWVTDGDLGPPPPDTDGDGSRDPYDNCAELANPDQSDADFDGIGDACDDNDDRDRGGECAVCDGCMEDEDCGEGGSCARMDANIGFCTARCDNDTQCPGETTCFFFHQGRGYCLNSDLQRVGPCPERFVCGGPRPAPPDDGACHVCETCEADADCANGGVCADLGAGPVCTRPCEATRCRGDSVCAVFDGRSLCVNPEADTHGICEETYVCGQGYVEPEPEPEPDAGPEPEPVDESPVGETPVDEAPVDESGGVELDVERVGTKKSGGCVAAPGGAGGSPLFLLLPAILLGVTWRRRAG